MNTWDLSPVVLLGLDNFKHQTGNRMKIAKTKISNNAAFYHQHAAFYHQQADQNLVNYVCSHMSWHIKQLAEPTILNSIFNRGRLKFSSCKERANCLICRLSLRHPHKKKNHHPIVTSQKSYILFFLRASKKIHKKKLRHA